MTFLRNQWYLAAWSDELAEGQILSRTFLGERIVLFRGHDGAPAALTDRCPHRFAPLNLGVVVGPNIRCAYHGLVFGADGRCVESPHGDGSIPPRASVRAYPIIERHEGLWIWMGEAEQADPGLIPDLRFIEQAPRSAKYNGYLYTAANYQLMSDNILDLSHADYLHPGTLDSGGTISRTIPKVRGEGDHIFVDWSWSDAPPFSIFAAHLPSGPGHEGWIKVHWSPPAVMVLHTGASAHIDGGGLKSVSLRVVHIMTPETDTSTHYFFYSTRDFAVGDAELSVRGRANAIKAFADQDKPVIEAVQRAMETTDLWALEPAILPGDRGAVQARRVLDRLGRLEIVANPATRVTI